MAQCARNDGHRMQSNRCVRRYAPVRFHVDARTRRSPPVASKWAVPYLECRRSRGVSRPAPTCRTRARCTRFGTCIDSFEINVGGRTHGVCPATYRTRADYRGHRRKSSACRSEATPAATVPTSAVRSSILGRHARMRCRCRYALGATTRRHTADGLAVLRFERPDPCEAAFTGEAHERPDSESPRHAATASEICARYRDR
ncbi:hypothetical protein BCCR75502_07234 (plasmid) [Burkholderia sola]|nr:hypothetical protein BCCR12632_07237 [Burkholderia cenocepacia]CAG2383560.1 hypothetical protein BCCR75389_07194 [Burkholderia cenocepacia]CAG2383566.1 hypothetical protein BCCR75388_07202 [Burkholderia cenocepacia]CAG2383610.1 hypothetical protein BCCR75384_07229 [Burkholderia cenocepacia]CAG2383668.1 hypothetical protein BCCR75387_07224 [Burkholderia cenocepacia]